jgi:hypothetical protein
MRVKLQQVESDNLAAIGYDPETQTLRIRFQSGSSYDYHDVPEHVHGALMKSESKNQFFQQEIVGKMYRYEKVNPAKERTVKNNQQKQSEERAKAAAPKAAQPAAVETPKSATPAPQPAPPTPAVSKQDATIAKLKEGWKSKGIDLSKLEVRDDGKFKVLHITPEWPSIQIGPTGGLVVLELRSYPDAFTAAMEGLERYKKQQVRDHKKVAPTAPAASTQAPKAETPTQKKKRQDAAVEKQLETASA